MGQKVRILIKNCDFAPDDTTINVETWQVRNGRRVYFENATVVDGVSIPADTVLVLEPQDGGYYETSAVVTGTWSHHLGIHRGTMMSRDDDERKGYESLEAVQQASDEAFKYFESRGYHCWFSYAYPPGRDIEKRVVVRKSVHYR